MFMDFQLFIKFATIVKYVIKYKLFKNVFATFVRSIASS